MRISLNLDPKGYSKSIILKKKIIDMLRLDHLNFEERIHVEDLI